MFYNVAAKILAVSVTVIVFTIYCFSEFKLGSLDDSYCLIIESHSF